MLTNSETFNLKLGILGVAQYGYSSESIGHKCSSFIVCFIHIVSNDALQHVVIAGYFIFSQGLDNLSRSEVIHRYGVYFEQLR